MKNQRDLPAGWDRKRVDKVLAHYEQQSDDEAAAEDNAAFEGDRTAIMQVPIDLVPKIREMIAKYVKSS